MATLYIRSELFEQGLYPLQQAKLTTNVLITLFQNLNLVSSIDYKITLKDWVEQACKCVPGMTEGDAKVYFLTYRSLLDHIENPTTFQQNQMLSLQEYKVDVRCFALYMGLQLFSEASKVSSSQRSHLVKDTWGIMDSTNMLQNQAGVSPRSKCTKLNYSQTDYQIALHFVKNHLKFFLKIVSSDINNSEVSLSQTEFNTLRILFKVKLISTSKQSQHVPYLSLLTPFFQSNHSKDPPAHSVKVHMNIITDWLMTCLAPADLDDGSIVYLNGLNKCMTIMDAQQLKDRDVRIVACEDSYIYIDTSVQCAQISHCVNCTVMIAAVQKSCSIEMCENTNVVVAAPFLRIGNCIDCTLNCYVVNAGPVVYGDLRALVIAPHNCAYQEIGSHLKDADIPFLPPGSVTPNKDFGQLSKEALHNFARPLELSDQSQNYTIMAPMDFMRLSLPKKFMEAQLLLCPPEYEEALQARQEMVLEMQNRIKGLKLSQEQEKNLHAAIQGHFREWFVSKGHHKQVSELVRNIDLQ